MEFLSAHAYEIGSFIGGLIAGGIGGSLITMRLTRQHRVIGGGSVADQSRARATGDIVGRDKTTSTNRT
jgi:hypothetical protein